MPADLSPVRNHILGLMRFSYPSVGGFSKTDDDIGALQARLFEPARLERRFQLFEALALPALLAQSDQDFTMVFLTGLDMPVVWRDRLADLLAPMRGARIVALESLPHFAAIRRAVARATPEGVTHMTGFRLDDDDAMDTGFVARMRATVSALLPVAGLDQPLVTGCNRGYFLERKSGGNLLYEVVERTPIGLGLAMTAPVGFAENIYRRNHRHAGQYYNTYTDAVAPAFIRSVHADNDSEPHASGLISAVGWDEAAPVIAARFPFTADHLRGL